LDEIVGFHGGEDGGLENWKMGTMGPVAAFVREKGKAKS
jgi:hypothetical protein